MPRTDLSSIIKQWAADLGFDSCGIAQAAPIGRAEYLRGWLGSGRAGDMFYLHRHFTKRVDPRELLAGARSVVIAALLYHQPRSGFPKPGHGQTSDARGHRGRVARYAWGDDYHGVVKEKLFALVDRLRRHVAEQQLPEQVPFEAKVCVDTAPLLERELAASAGIGWIGKNTMVLDRRLGSYFFLGEVVTTIELTPDEPVPDYCGTCRACLDACPTQAFPAPYEMDASRCISYLSIEHRTDTPPELADSMGDWVFGCDVCQEVCPYNRRAPVTGEPRFAIRAPGPEPMLEDLLAWSEEDYRTQLRGSAMKRAKLDMLKRNARIALENAKRTKPNPSDVGQRKLPEP